MRLLTGFKLLTFQLSSVTKLCLCSIYAHQTSRRFNSAARLTPNLSNIKIQNRFLKRISCTCTFLSLLSEWELNYDTAWRYAKGIQWLWMYRTTCTTLNRHPCTGTAFTSGELTIWMAWHKSHNVESFHTINGLTSMHLLLIFVYKVWHFKTRILGVNMLFISKKDKHFSLLESLYDQIGSAFHWLASLRWGNERWMNECKMLLQKGSLYKAGKNLWLSE